MVPGAAHTGPQGFAYPEGLTRETVGATQISLHVLTVPPGARAKAHRHDGHETCVYQLSGRAVTWWGERLEHRMETGPGELMFIPAGVPHLPTNPYAEPAVAVIARADPNGQESVVLMPELDGLVP
jgi:uncharacterized RmlC-like cupin family protein